MTAEALPPADSATRAISFAFGDRTMPIVVGSDVHDECVAFCETQEIDRLFLVADANVWMRYGAELLRRYGRRLAVEHVLVEPREAAKTLSSAERVLEEFVARGATRRSCVAAVGGGLTGNIAGIVAGLLYRGIRLLHIPTTLLAMSDSILSMKQAVNGRRGKNQFGLFHLPVASFISLQFLATLPPREMTAGLYELAKNCLVFDPDRTSTLLALAPASGSPESWLPLVMAGIEAKQKLLASDGQERELGLCLEYGHTAGHALESQRYGLTHGAAVALGMLVAAAIAHARGMLRDDEYWLHFELLTAVDPHLAFPAELDVEATLELIRHDNKHGYLAGTGDTHPFVLLDAIGSPAMTAGKPLVQVREDEIRAAFARAGRDLRSAPRAAMGRGD